MKPLRLQQRKSEKIAVRDTFGAKNGYKKKQVNCDEQIARQFLNPHIL